MTGIQGINHITLAVSDLARAVAFYQNALGAALRAGWSGGAYLELGTVWLCLSQGPVDLKSDDSHIAFGCAPQDFDQLSQKIENHASLWKENQSEGDSLYFLDPDGHRWELHLGDLQSRLSHYAKHPENGVTLYPSD